MEGGDKLEVERVPAGEVWDYHKGKPRKTYVYVCKLGDAELYRGDTNQAFAGAFRKGYRAAQSGETKRANPYNAFDTCRGGPTFARARAFHKYWNQGFDAYGKSEG